MERPFCDAYFGAVGSECGDEFGQNGGTGEIVDTVREHDVCVFL